MIMASNLCKKWTPRTSYIKSSVYIPSIGFTNSHVGVNDPMISSVGEVSYEFGEH
uniref:Uncharacterized protein n=1 Tax=Rhizophora mucronata TaxID=61149 RepID=A0A2P2N642_RHIMU